MNALSDIVAYLLQTVLNLALLAILLRFLLQLVRADFYNPVSQFLAKVTNPLVLPVRRVIPAYRGLDLSTLLLALLLQMAAIVALLALNGLGPPGVLTLLVWSVLGIVGLLVNIYFFALLAMIILSWIAAWRPAPSAVIALPAHRAGDGALSAHAAEHGRYRFLADSGVHPDQRDPDCARAHGGSGGSARGPGYRALNVAT